MVTPLISVIGYAPINGEGDKIEYICFVYCYIDVSSGVDVLWRFD